MTVYLWSKIRQTALCRIEQKYSLLCYALFGKKSKPDCPLSSITCKVKFWDNWPTKQKDSSSLSIKALLDPKIRLQIVDNHSFRSDYISHRHSSPRTRSPGVGRLWLLWNCNLLTSWLFWGIHQNSQDNRDFAQKIIVISRSEAKFQFYPIFPPLRSRSAFRTFLLVKVDLFTNSHYHRYFHKHRLQIVLGQHPSWQELQTSNSAQWFRTSPSLIEFHFLRLKPYLSRNRSPLHKSPCCREISRFCNHCLRLTSSRLMALMRRGDTGSDEVREPSPPLDPICICRFWKTDLVTLCMIRIGFGTIDSWFYRFTISNAFSEKRSNSHWSQLVIKII